MNKIYNFQDIYTELGVDFSQLGSVMLDIDPRGIPPFRNMESLYENKNSSVASGSPHVTLLYGLMQPATVWKDYVNKVLEGWTCQLVTVDKVDFFDTTDIVSDPYFCIIARVLVTPQLQEGHDRLQLLPHIDTFPGYEKN